MARKVRVYTKLLLFCTACTKWAAACTNVDTACTKLYQKQVFIQSKGHQPDSAFLHGRRPKLSSAQNRVQPRCHAPLQPKRFVSDQKIGFKAVVNSVSKHIPWYLLCHYFFIYSCVFGEYFRVQPTGPVALLAHHARRFLCERVGKPAAVNLSWCIEEGGRSKVAIAAFGAFFQEVEKQ